MAKAKKKSIQYVDSSETAEKAASGFAGKSVRLPEGMSFFPTIKEDKEFRFRFAPYIVGKGNPEAAEGSAYYTRKYAVHGSVGMGEDGKGGDMYVCSRRVFNKPCAVCDYLGVLRRNPNTDPELLKALRIKDRQLSIVRNQSDKEKGWQILDLSYHALGRQLEAKLKASRRSAADEDEVPMYPFKNFYFLEGGATVKVMFETDPKMKFKFYQAKNIEIVPTKEVLSDDLLEEMPCLDDLLVETPYKVLEQILTEGSAGPDEDEDDDDDSPPPPKAKKGKPPVEDDEDTDDEEQEEEEGEDSDDDTPEPKKAKHKKGDVVKFSFKGKTVKGTVLAVSAAGMYSVKSELRDNPHSLDEDEIEGLVKAGKEEAKPGSPKAKAEAKKRAAEVEDDEDDEDEQDELDEDEESEEEMEDEDEDEEKPKKRPAGKTATKKPAFTDDEDDDDDFSLDDEDEDEDEEEEKPKKKPARK